MNRITSALIFFATAFVNIRRLCPTVFNDDSPEVVGAAMALGITHPPGTPVMVLLGRLACLFPVGSWVRLNNDHIGKVIAANIEDYTRPVVTVMFDKNLNPIKRYTLDLREEHKLGIVDGLPSDHFNETGLMDGF